MAIIGIFAKSISAVTGGNIVGNSATLQKNIGASNIWGHPCLQNYSSQSDNVTDLVLADVAVTNFIDAKGSHDVNAPGIFADGCTSITFFLQVQDGASARALCTIEFSDTPF